MFVKGDAVRIGEREEIVSSSLKTYKGDIQNITLEGKHTQMVILPAFEGQMQLQPLAGDQSFLGGGFPHQLQPRCRCDKAELDYILKYLLVH